MTLDCRKLKHSSVRIAAIRICMGLLCLAVTLCWSVSANGQWIKRGDLVGPHVDSEPFDLIQLNKQGEDALLKVLPLGDRKPDPPYVGTTSVIFEYFAENEDQLEVPISSIKSIQTFNELLIEEANVWLAQEDFTRAFRNYLYVYDHGGKQDPKLVKALNTCMFQDGKSNFESREFELALSIYEDIYQKDPDFKPPGLNRTLAEIVIACYDGIIQKQFDEVNYLGVRQTLETVVKKYDKESVALKGKWLGKFKAKSDALLAQARKLARENQGRQAHLAAKQAEQMFPGREDTLQLQKDLLNKFPMVVVGVSQSAADADPERIEHWGSRRVGRLTQRTLIELIGLTDEGGKYEFLNGMVYRADEIGFKYIFEIKDDVSTFGVPPVTPYAVAARLSSIADESSPNYRVNWRKIVSEIAIDGENNSVNVTLRKPFIRPESLLKIAYSDIDPDGQPDQNGAYVMTAFDRDISTYELNPKYERIENRQHPVIVEQLFDRASTAVDELVAGNIDIVDRIPIADITRLKQIKEIEVRPYLLPTVHMLIPKIRGEMENDANFRNGLSHAVDRNLLVQDMICGGNEVGGCEPISGPFPIGTEENDQIAYGYDLKVRPLPFNSQLGTVLVEIALQARPPQRPDPIPKPKLVLAHPDSSVATNAAEAIARMWTEIGIATATRKLKAEETYPPDDDWDFLYYEAMLEEPLADATRIIGPEGFAQKVSAPIEQTLRNLSYSESWQGTCSTLRRLHRQVAVDLSVLPLWQIKEHYAYRTTVREIGRDLIHLYQNADRWKIDLTAEDESGK